VYPPQYNNLIAESYRNLNISVSSYLLRFITDNIINGNHSFNNKNMHKKYQYSYPYPIVPQQRGIDHGIE